MANGDLVSRTNASVTYNGAGIDLATTANVNLLRQNLFLTTNGGLFAGTLTILFPAGMTVAPSDKHQRAFDKIAMMNVPLNQSLIPKNAVTFTKQNFPNHERSSGLMFCHTERIPIRFPASSVSFTASNGQFSFSTGGANTPDREQQTVAMRNLISMGSAVKAARIPASNDFYFTGGLQALGTVRFGARVGNISTPHLVDLVLSPPPVNATVGETTTHFPKIPLKWTSLGKILYSSGSVDPGNSSLPSNVASSLTYLRGLQSGNCQGQAAGEVPQPSTVAFSPVGGSWTFTADGGISGQCSGLENGGALAPRWGGYRKSGSDFFAHTITGGNDVCRFLSAGNAVVGSEVAAIPVGERPAALLLSGHASAAGDESVERPGTFEYGQGLTDYPGINIRAFGTYNGRSRLADVQTALYPLAPEAKYYIRPGGVSGRTLTVGAANISLAAYGSNFNLTALNLAFLDGRNVNSGVAGNVRVNTPNATFFNLDFRKLLFGPQGQLQEATLGANQGLKTLGYWNFQFTPLAIDFPQPKSCPPPDPSVGFVRVSSMAAAIPNLTTKPVTGTLGFYDSDLVTEGSAVGAGHPKISRFEPGGLLTVPGPGLEAWNVNCTSGIYLNQFASSLGASGSLNAGGLMDIPFFQDMPVHLRTASTSGPTVPLLHVRSALSTTGAYDSNHRGTPLGVDVATHNTSPSYHPVASQNWQGIVNFDIPVAFAQGSNTFRSQAPVTDSLLIFQLSEAIPKMTPSHAELLFDGQANVGVEAFLKQVNVSTLLTGAVLPGVQPLVNAVIASTGKLDEVLGDNIHALVRPAVSASAALRADVTFFNSLKSPASRDLQFNLLGGSLTSDMLSVFSSETGPVNGRARADIQQKIDSAKSSLDTARGFLDSAAELVDLAEAVGSFVGNNSPPAPPDDFRLNEVKKLFDRASNDLTTASTALASPLNSALTSAIASAVVTEALNDLRAKWVPTDPAQATELYANATAAEFSAELATALTDRLAGSPFAGAAQQLIRQHLTDVKFVARQAVDESLALATGLLPNAATSPFLSALGSVGGQLGAASIKGYARFKGDSIDELRLDGNATLKVPDDMKFDAFFLLKAVDSTTPGGKCLSDGGAKAEISMGASAKLQWAGQAPLDISLGGKVALGNTGSPVGLCGDLKLIGELDFNEVRMKQLALGFGFGANNYYLYGRAAAKVAAMDVAAGIFVGRTCDLAPILNADPDIGKAVTAANLTPPYTGAAVYVFGGISLMPIIGIPPSCLIDLRVGGGQGFFAFDTPAAIVAGYKTTQSVTGELLCIASVTGQQDTLITGAGTFSGGSPRFVSLAGSSRFTASGEVGIGWLSYTFEKSVGINLKVIPQLDWSVDY